jgi:UDP-2,4-diacetamido-2,4,6-trideoxy-beta-L-altropyranose hydrolase
VDHRKVIIFRVDGNSEIGIGHIMRCLALAEGFDRWINVKIIFVSSCLPSIISKRVQEKYELINRSGMHSNIIEDIEGLVGIANQNDANLIIVDGYNFNEHYQDNLVQRIGSPILFFDDYGHSKHYSIDFILNRGLFANKVKYNLKSKKTKLLLGPKYSLIRNEFIQQRALKKREFNEKDNKVLVTFGGSDQMEVTRKVVRALMGINERKLEVKVIVSPFINFDHTLKDYLKFTNHKIEYIKGTNNMALLMNWADLAITAGGTSLIEMAYMGLPSISIKVVDNQKASEILDSLYNTTVFLGEDHKVKSSDIRDKVNELLKNEELRKDMSTNGQELVDDYGPLRILKEIGLI